MFKIQTILHPTDFSDSSDPAFHLACSLARDYQARLILLHVKPPIEAVPGDIGVLPPEDPETLARLEEALHRMEPTEPGLTVERYVKEGDPAKVIVHTAREMGADLVVMGTHGRTGLRRLLMGSVAEIVLRGAPCPVLTVKMPARETVMEREMAGQEAGA